jgi:hypothetical protein
MDRQVGNAHMPKHALRRTDACTMMDSKQIEPLSNFYTLQEDFEGGRR